MSSSKSPSRNAKIKRKTPDLYAMPCVTTVGMATIRRTNAAISSEALQKLTVAELHGLISSLPTYEHVLIYGGTKPLDDVLAAIKAHFPAVVT